MSPVTRPHQLKIMLSEEEKNWLDLIADAQRLSVSDFVRQKIHDSLRDHYADQGLLYDVLCELKVSTPLRALDLVNELSTKHGQDIHMPPLGNRINAALQALVGKSFAKGNPISGFTLTSGGKHARATRQL